MLTRSEQTAHEGQCPEKLVDCPYKDIGCTQKFKRKDTVDHLGDAVVVHLRLACEEAMNAKGKSPLCS